MINQRYFKAIPAAALLGLALGNTHCAAEPRVKCTVTSGPAAARYTLVGQKTGMCTGVTFPFADLGEGLGLEAYSPLVTDPNVNSEVTSFAIKSGYVGTLVNNADSQALSDSDPAHKPYALGKFDTVYPDDHDVCTASGFSAAEVNLPDVPAHMDDAGNSVDEQPATHIKYEWSNVRVIVSAASIGTQTFADLTYTQDGCSAQYHVSILSPNVSCASADDPTKIDPTLCNSESDPSKGFPGSGIGLGIPVTCDPTLQLCLPNKTAP
jgi:hypothetical protein